MLVLCVVAPGVVLASLRGHKCNENLSCIVCVGWFIGQGCTVVKVVWVGLVGGVLCAGAYVNIRGSPGWLVLRRVFGAW